MQCEQPAVLSFGCRPIKVVYAQPWRSEFRLIEDWRDWESSIGQLSMDRHNTSQASSSLSLHELQERRICTYLPFACNLRFSFHRSRDRNLLKHKVLILLDPLYKRPAPCRRRSSTRQFLWKKNTTIPPEPQFGHVLRALQPGTQFTAGRFVRTLNAKMVYASQFTRRVVLAFVSLLALASIVVAQDIVLTGCVVENGQE